MNRLLMVCTLNWIDDFITECVLFAAPSTEKFQVDLSRFSNSKAMKEDSE